VSDLNGVLSFHTASEVDPDEFIQAAMRWHFGPDTGSAYWLRRAKTLDFDPCVDVKTFDDLRLFPNVANELRDVRIEDLIPQGISTGDVFGVFESGGTTGDPKRVLFLREWTDALLGAMASRMDDYGVARDVNWLSVAPSGPHMIGEIGRQIPERRGGIRFSIDMDPRWVKRLVRSGRADEANAYADHLVEQAATVLRTQDIGVILTTPPLLERLAEREDLVEIIREKVDTILWGGAHMDADTRHLFRTELFPEINLYGFYGSTMVLGGCQERFGLGDDDPCVFDPPSQNITLAVVDPATGDRVPYGRRGQVVMNHISTGMLLVNNLERDEATRIEPRNGTLGDSVADVTPVRVFDNAAVIEGVY
jgi:phenylacetate-coenzyme A ligase PaaK-like adenylate-forming protein